MPLSTSQRLSIERGAHPDCVMSSWEKICDACLDITNQAFYDLYSSAPTARALASNVIRDSWEDPK